MINVSAEQLRLFIERIERLVKEKQHLSEDMKDVFLEAKSQGYEPKAMRALIKLRQMERDARMEQEALLEAYKRALGMAD